MNSENTSNNANNNPNFDLMFHLQNQQPAKLLQCNMPNIKNVQSDFEQIISTDVEPITHLKNPEIHAKISALLKTLRTVSVDGIKCLTADVPQAKDEFCKVNLSNTGLTVAKLNEIESLIDLYTPDLQETINWLTMISADSQTYCNGDRELILKIRTILSKVGNILKVPSPETKCIECKATVCPENGFNKTYGLLFVVFLLVIAVIIYFMFFRTK